MLRKIPLRLGFVEQGEHKHETVLPLDVNTRNGAEWLKFRRKDGSETEIRLDAISGLSYADAD